MMSRFYLFLLCLSSVGCASTNPEDAPFKASDGFYLRGALTQVSIDGDFDGSVALVGGGEAIFIPDTGSGEGWFGAIGTRARGLRFELAVTETEHDGSVLGFPGFDVARTAWDLNLVFNFLRDTRYQPYFLLGFGYMTADIENATTDGNRLYDADLSGFSFPVGGGLEVFATPHFSADLRIVKRFGSFGSANGTPIEDSLDADSTELSLGITLTF